MKAKTLVFLFAVTCALSAQHSQQYYPENDTLVVQKLEKWQDLKFGLLMHWGPYSQWGIVESWSICPEDYGWCERKKGSNPKNYFEYKKEYEKLGKTFNPVRFNPDKWARAAKNAGMKYVIFTTKHHDGFCMFDTKYTDYKITDPSCPFSTNPKANITKEIFSSFRAEGLLTGAYFSKPDWHSPFYWDPYFPPFDRNVNYDPELYPKKWGKFVQFTHNQILELMSGYGKVDILWLDGGWVAKQPADKLESAYAQKAKNSGSGFIKNRIVSQDIRLGELVEKARKLQPGLIVVDRAVPGKFQNYLTPENRVPKEALPYPWESCIISGGGWAYTPNAKYMSVRKAIHTLVDIVSKGGNLLLNIAPSALGDWDEGAYNLLRGIGKWMDQNSKAIYGTRAFSPYSIEQWRFTKSKSGKELYIFYLIGEGESIPEAVNLGKIDVSGFERIALFGSTESIQQKDAGSESKIVNPQKVRDNPPNKNALVFELAKQEIK